MEYLKITNSGEIENNALNLIGASTKRGDDTKIGFFGSGVKYALSYLIRNNYKIRLFSGEREIMFATKKVNYRGKEFEVIIIDNQDTSFTTEMGPEWQLWSSIREIYCNALDEGSGALDIVEEIPCGQIGITAFYVEITTEIKEFVLNIKRYFAIDKNVAYEFKFNKTAGDTPWFSSGSLGNVKFYTKESGNKNNCIIFRKGIRVKELTGDSIFDYDFDSLEINESREAKNIYDAFRQLGYIFSKCDNPLVLKRVIEVSTSDRYIENDIYWSYAEEFSEAWMEAIGNRIVVPDKMASIFRHVQNPLYLPMDLVESLMKFFKDKLKLPFGLNTYGQKFVIVEAISDFQEMVFNSVISFLKDCKIELPYPIQFCEFIDEGVAGYADTENKVIYIGISTLEKGKLMVASTLLEEKLHIETGCSDETREFQDAIFNDYVRYIQLANKRLI